MQHTAQLLAQQQSTPSVYTIHRLTCAPAGCSMELQLVLNVRCGDPANCKRSGQALFNSTNQAALTRTLAQGGVALIPNTTQVGGPAS